MFIIGLVFLISATTDTRGDMVSDYNAVVDTWTKTARSAFAATSYTMVSAAVAQSSVNVVASNLTKMCGGISNKFQAVNTPDKVNQWSSDQEKGSDLTKYVPLRYECNGLNAGTTEIKYECSGCKAVYGSYGIRGSSTYSANCLSPRCTTKTSVVQDSSECGKLGGTYTSCGRRRTSCRRSETPSPIQEGVVRRNDGGSRRRRASDKGRCSYRRYVSQICNRLYSSNGFGSSSSGVIGCSQSATYFTYSNRYSSSKVLGMLRSSADPYIKALEQTNGSLDFGMTQASKVVAGVVCLVIGILLFIPCCILIYVVTNKNKRQGGMSDGSYGGYGGQNNAMVAQPMGGPGGPGDPYAPRPNMVPPGPIQGQPIQGQPIHGAPAGDYKEQPGYPASGPPVGQAYQPQAPYPAQPVAPPPAPAPAAPPAYGQLPPGWEATQDASGKTYYYNRDTQQTSWDPPSSY